ncbi:GNAT family protein [uncultured Maricaulis sp.]|uniref:GNAT family N-acetyltransferase n=1 Tax=uncultured Maricaulis sp. TaxID=174710 RepID=UPI0030DA7B8C
MRDRIEIISQRLRLVALDVELTEWQLNDRARFFEALGVEPEPSWPPELVGIETMEWTRDQLAAHPHDAGWYSWVYISPIMNRLLGIGGFKGTPNAAGEVEIDYSMLVSYRERGLATEAVNALIGWAYNHDTVKRVIAKTRGDGHASHRVLEKAGFVQAGTFLDPDAGTEVIRWSHDRAQIAA